MCCRRLSEASSLFIECRMKGDRSLKVLPMKAVRGVGVGVGSAVSLCNIVWRGASFEGIGL